MKRKRPSFIQTFLRFIKLLCPACGRSSIVLKPFRIRHHCSSCGALFQREDGFFVGAISVNVVTTELIILMIYTLSLPLLAGSFEMILAVLLVVALVFPIAFYHHSWSLWLGFDHFVEGLPGHVP